MTGLLSRFGALIFLGFFLVAIWGFWPTYFSGPFHMTQARQQFPLYYVHAISMTLWFCLLVVQPLLIRKGYRSLHRQIGRITPLFVAFILTVMVLLIRQQLIFMVGPDQAVPEEQVAMIPPFLFISLASAALFGAFFTLALIHRKRTALHARYILCTVFPIITAATDRIINRTAPTEATFPVLVGSWLLLDIVLLTLGLWERRKLGRHNPFLIAAGLMFAMQVSMFTLAQTRPWRSFFNWFVS
ncbi:hypothetical protein GRI89_17260 [Altererythrobacter salegens]|uniref:Uncharacterized protein n=2 Tax=Croceibacterium salegens TaxID=1737568 RepID=A0A6I4SZC0_9SPHN|nr:hypothetical protein [Croceibacterium salegens]MXO57996.1 hypothetical protein [Croceibacterium salegens]MXO60126.1 hypothetical protein [Croceibacterium salegens]MXO60700.1 hypothetical protein [Croceibacterium salegens]MXO61296.1 hypothetical protein [Croceibacterium salegens]